MTTTSPRWVLVLLALVGSGCATPRQRSCRALALALQEAEAQRHLDTESSRPLAHQGGRAIATAAWVRSMNAQGDLGAPAEAFASAIEEEGRATLDLDAIFAWLLVKTKAGGFRFGDLPDTKAEREELERAKADMEVVLRHCSGLLVPSDTPAPSAECQALKSAVEICITPLPDARVGDHHRRCLTNVATVHGPVAFEGALARSRVRLEDLTPLADAINASASEVVDVLVRASRAMTRSVEARARAQGASTTIQSLCAP